MPREPEKKAQAIGFFMWHDLLRQFERIVVAVEKIAKHLTRPRVKTLVVVIGAERKIGPGGSDMNAIHSGFKRPLTLQPTDADGATQGLEGMATGTFTDIVDPATGNGSPFLPGGSANFAFVPDPANADNLRYFVECRGPGKVSLAVKADANLDPNATDLIEFDTDFEAVPKQAIVLGAVIGNEVPI